ncbi:MAG: hypothetical protein HQK89_15180 [Nitrospirae bacterium]|nr:hypothetical protein [Nitrospirota bacterium]
MKESCPGSSEIKNPHPEDLACVFCGKINEVWSDESEIECKGCSRLIKRNMKETCINWCPAAKECVGIAKYERMMGIAKK